MTQNKTKTFIQLQQYNKAVYYRPYQEIVSFSMSQNLQTSMVDGK